MPTQHQNPHNTTPAPAPVTITEKKKKATTHKIPASLPTKAPEKNGARKKILLVFPFYAICNILMSL